MQRRKVAKTTFSLKLGTNAKPLGQLAQTTEKQAESSTLCGNIACATGPSTVSQPVSLALGSGIKGALKKPELHRPSVFGDINEDSGGSDKDREDSPPRTNPGLASVKDKGPKRNLDTFLEELKQNQEQREQQKQQRQQQLMMRRNGGLDRHASGSRSTDTAKGSAFDSKGILDADDGETTNIFISNVHPDIDEHALCMAFGVYGPIGSVKIMWPRTAEEHARNKNNGFVSFMDRQSAAEALRCMDGKDLGGLSLRLCWGRKMELPAKPMFVLDGENPTQLPSTGFPFNARVSGSKRVRHSRRTVLVADDEESGDIPEIAVERPLDRRLTRLIHWTIDHVIEFGPEFEQLLITQMAGKKRFAFLTAYESPEHVYYRWKMYSLLNGDTKSSWSSQMFFMYDSGPVWIPPSTRHDDYHTGNHVLDQEYEDGGSRSAATVSSSEEDEEAERIRDNISRDRLGERACERLEKRVRRVCGLQRGAIADAMVFAMEHAHAAEEVADIICRSILDQQASAMEKLGRLFLISDILHNCSVSVANAWQLRRAFETRVAEVFKALAVVYRGMQDEQESQVFAKHVLSVLAVWEVWMMFPEENIQDMAREFL
ncbi:hypothetical protein GGI07_001275 [Coemansia sp. Benny D115]|nr:hypothetical protein GGI07_001275 [Coemansia sp. Benny D115]